MTTHQSLALGFFIAIGLVLGVCGEDFKVTSAQQLIELLDISKPNNFNANITLLNDLDFSDSPLTTPFGTLSDSSCVSYTGVFEGNGHTIKGLVMNNTGSQLIIPSGLFCGLGSATVQNLVIDSSCSFSGSMSVGALSCELTGSLTVINVTNKADVSGSQGIGGFVGAIQGLEQGIEVTFKDCVNDGNITGHGMHGGFVGAIIYSGEVTMTFSGSINHANISGEGYVGGFVGVIMENGDVTMNFSDSINNANISGETGVGGFVGVIMENGKLTMTISNCTNTGMISAALGAGGLVGIIFTPSNVELSVLHIINSANKGNVSAKNTFACGLICAGSYNVNTTVLNSINKGSVNAPMYAFGITNIITKARNVVSMGEVNASSDSFTFWNASTNVDLFFGLDGKCVNCSEDSTLFVHSTNTDFYVVESGEHVNDLLNAEVKKQNYGMFWTKELELVEPSPSPSSQSGGLSGGNKHGVSVFWIGVVVALAAHVAMAQ